MQFTERSVRTATGRSSKKTQLTHGRYDKYTATIKTLKKGKYNNFVDVSLIVTSD